MTGLLESGQSALVEFSYRLTGSGWADARLAHGDDWTELSASYLSDTVGELLLALAQLQDGDIAATASWEQEPGEYRWLFRREADDVTLKVLAFPDSWPPQPDAEGTVVFEARTSLNEMAQSFAVGLRAVLDEWGEKGYKQQWIEHPFPTALLERVEGHLR